MLVNAAGKSVPCSPASAIPEWFLLPLRGLFRLIDDIKSCGTFITEAVASGAERTEDLSGQSNRSQMEQLLYFIH